MPENKITGDVLDRHLSDKTAYKQHVDNRIRQIVKDANGVLTNVREAAFMLYMDLFNKVPHRIELEFDGEYLNTTADEQHSAKRKIASKGNTILATAEVVKQIEDGTFDFSDDVDIDALEETDDNGNYTSMLTFKGQSIYEQTTYVNLIEKYPGKEIAVYRIDEDPVIVMGDDVRSILYHKDNYIYVLSEEPVLNEYIKNSVAVEEPIESERYFDYVVYDNHGFDTTELSVKDQHINLEMNYNDDLPDDEIKKFCTESSSGLCILFGAPGTGKTSYIRHLMYSCKNTDFMILNTSCFDAINDSSFVNMIINNRDSVIILEDCEDLMVERLNGNSRIATLLNLSDGILGDALRLKFICTFNAKIGRIDPAVLRKGRTHVKYEFKPLEREKAKALADSIGKELPSKKASEGYTLAEIYYSDNKLVDGNIDTKIGFNTKK